MSLIDNLVTPLKTSSPLSSTNIASSSLLLAASELTIISLTMHLGPYVFCDGLHHQEAILILISILHPLVNVFSKKSKFFFEQFNSTPSSV